jgi:polar amino acid transport system substrate-binding protein
MSALALLLIAVLLSCLSGNALAEKLRIVTEPWEPYVFTQDHEGREGSARGLDYETTAIVFARLGIEIEWQFLPWKRCLAMLAQGQADGALDIFRSDEREDNLLYPAEPLSDVNFVLFQANARPHTVNTLDDLHGLTVGVSPGYVYDDGFDQSTLFKREPAPSHEANFGKLIRGRIDLLITDRRVGQHLLDQLGLRDQVSELPLVIRHQQQYLALRKSAGMNLLVRRFGDELKRFKQEPGYAQILAHYEPQSLITAQPAPETPMTPGLDAKKTVEQQESSAH